MADVQRKATVDTENSHIVKLAKRKLAIRGIVQGSTFPWMEIPVQHHPRAPNPYDRYSKREWEKAMSAYRHELREKEKIANAYKKATSDPRHQANSAESSAAA